MEQIIRQLCDEHGFAVVIDATRAALECARERLGEADSPLANVAGVVVQKLTDSADIAANIPPGV